RHPECDTPEGDEVRLALHAAAAQLLDPVVRRHLIAKWTGQRMPAPVPRKVPVRAPARTAEFSTKLLEADAILTLGLFGGWNQRSLRGLRHRAPAGGVSTARAAQTLPTLPRRRRGPRPAAARPAPHRRHARTREEFAALEGDTPPVAHAPSRRMPVAAQ